MIPPVLVRKKRLVAVLSSGREQTKLFTTMALTPNVIQEYHVFLASPGDMSPERQQIRAFFDEHNKTTAGPLGIHFTVIDWENYSSAGVGRPQDLITRQTLEKFRPSLALVICLMGSRFGSPTGVAESGTEEEYNWALKAREEGGWPEVKWFFKHMTSIEMPTNPENMLKAVEQWKKVLAFKKRLEEPGQAQAYYKEFEPRSFAETALFDLRAWLNDRGRPWFAALSRPRASIVPARKTPVLVSPEAYFRPLMDRSRLFSHVWSLVGRQQHLGEVSRFAGDGRLRVALLHGRPGMGKSKLLHAFSSQFATEHSIRPLGFIAERADLSQFAAEDVPPGTPLIIADDVHRSPYVDRLLAVAQGCPSAQLILCGRTYYLEQVRMAAARAGYEQSEILELEPLREMAKEDVIALARQVLGQDPTGLADAIATITRDCPLVTVVAAKLVADKAVPLAMLSQHDDFRHTVMSRFQEELLGDLGGRISSERAKAVLRMVAATEPVLPHDQRYIGAAAGFLGLDGPSVVEAFGILESIGVLLRRGRRVRITPDVLSEYVLREACISSTGQPTGYADRVYDAFRSICLAELLRNLGELDWREQQKG